MKEYLDLRHMTNVTYDEIHNPEIPVFFIPHHFVRKEESTTTKFRVVFDGSIKSSSGVSLNDALMIVPTLHDHLVDIITRFRCHVVAFTADIAKMYRQILVSLSNCDMQRILWRFDQAHPVQELRLQTVPYGTSCAPYLATYVLQQLAKDE